MIVEKADDLIHIEIDPRNLAGLYVIDGFELAYDVTDMIEIIIHV